MATAEEGKPGLLIVDDDPLITDTLSYVLGKTFRVYTADSRAATQRLMQEMSEPPELALVDLGLPPFPELPDEGFHLIGELLGWSPDMKILVLSGQNEETNARHARTLGAIDFVAKPCDPQTLTRRLLDALEVRTAEKADRARALAGPRCGIVGHSPPVERLRQRIEQFADSPFPVLIEGESGSGKELVAACLHRSSRRANKPFLALNCAAISPTLVEPTLFGYSKGAFTGAATARPGYFEDASDGTLFLDEIGELPFELQAKLLRVLENGEFQRVGETSTRRSNARIVAATNRDLRAEIRAGRFRADLYHRLSVFQITVPPLRELGEDKLALLEHFRAFYAAQAHKPPFTLDREATQRWLAYPFPGNVRELRNIVIRLTTKYGGTCVGVAALEDELDTEGAAVLDLPLPAEGEQLVELARKHLQSRMNFDLDRTLKQWEKAYVEAALKITHGNLSQAAKLLGVNRTTLYSRMQSYETAAQS